MAADVLHVEFWSPVRCLERVVFRAVALAAIFRTCGVRRIEGTLSIHSITTTSRREMFYWLAVLTTFAMGSGHGRSCGLYRKETRFLSAGILFAAYLSLSSRRSHGVFFNLNSPVLAFWIARPILTEGPARQHRSPTGRMGKSKTWPAASGSETGLWRLVLSRADRWPDHLDHVSRKSAESGVQSTEMRSRTPLPSQLESWPGVFNPAFPSLRLACSGRTMVGRRPSITTSAFVWPAGSVPDPSAVCRPFEPCGSRTPFRVR